MPDRLFYANTARAVRGPDPNGPRRPGFRPSVEKIAMSHRPLEDWEDPDPENEDEEGDDEYVCPSCGADVYEDCERCPSCGDYITPRSKSPSAAGSRWFVVAVLTMLGLMVLAAILAR
jgi:predicted RNA-binding Zn-ribbon protein involved in translation (DUF1610 family)